MFTAFFPCVATRCHGLPWPLCGTSVHHAKEDPAATSHISPQISHEDVAGCCWLLMLIAIQKILKKNIAENCSIFFLGDQDICAQNSATAACVEAIPWWTLSDGFNQKQWRVPRGSL